ncbi:hypothetical protein ENBRE01_3235 [Enteropsectra breve]|nr:hypothetical protein ENBRE01_3235 [Enteropsectra breve]
MNLINYLKKSLNKQATIETKGIGLLVGTIKHIDNKMNIVVENAVLRRDNLEIRLEQFKIKGNMVRTVEF